MIALVFNNGLSGFKYIVFILTLTLLTSVSLRIHIKEDMGTL